MTKFHKDVLKRIRLTCLDFPDTSEVRAWGHPNFKAGKQTFAVLEEYKADLSLAIKVPQSRKKTLLQDSRFYDTPYIGNKGWISLKVKAAPVDWMMINDLLETSYRLVASKRILKALASH